jgi:serine/threonine protein kinase
MGEVYRARDTTLNRDVALKVLPEAFASDPDRLARFEREAQVLASLNHPNIAAIYGVVEGPAATDVVSDLSRTLRALVLELVEGPTLADRIVSGPIPLDEALPIARQIADALDAAHEHGIIHRDLKPANVKVRSDGAVKVLDFGLAKALEPVAGAAHVSQSATITSPAMTRLGMVLGTAAYMSPEQARGHPAHKRGDVWAFGCVLYELLAGKRAFEGVEISDTMAAVLRAEPNWAAPRSSNAVWRRTTNGACAISVTRGSSSMTQSAAAHRIRRRDRLGEPGALPGSQPWPFSRLS